MASPEVQKIAEFFCVPRGYSEEEEPARPDGAMQARLIEQRHSTKAFLGHIRDQEARAVAVEFSVGWAITDRESAAITAIPKKVWADAVDVDGGHRDGAGLAELTGLLPLTSLEGYLEGTRVIVRRERPHPGAQLDLMETRDGWRYTCFAADIPAG